MKLCYYVLGNKNNQMYYQYREKYLQLLQSQLQELLQNNYIHFNNHDERESLFSQDFLLYPDVWANISYLYQYYCQWIIPSFWNIDTVKTNFINLFQNFLQKKGELWWKEKYIEGTNIYLLFQDLNPYNVLDTHPDHASNGGGLGWGKASQEEWLEIYKNTFDLLKKVDSGFFDEINFFIKKIVPFGTSQYTHNSCTYTECLWTLYLGLTLEAEIKELPILEAIIHESSHNKINHIRKFDSILNNDSQEVYYSAIRPDARPLMGVFIGYHAFAPTIYILLKAYQKWLLGKNELFFEKLILYYMKTKILQKVVKTYAHFTPLWQEISDEIDYVIWLMTHIVQELAPSKDLLLHLKSIQSHHFQEVIQKFPSLKF